MSRYSISRETTEGYETYVLRDRETNAEAKIVPALGNNAFAFRVEGAPILLEPPGMQTLKEKPSRYGVPILFPPNRIARGTFRYGSRVYRFPPNSGEHYSHGELCRRSWKVVSAEADADGARLVSEFRFAEQPDMLEVFPHPYTFRFAYSLRGGRLLLNGEIRNEGSDAAPFGLGFHPYFTAGEEALVSFPARTEYAVTDAFVTGQPAATDLCKAYRQGVRVGELDPATYTLFRMEDGTNRSEIRSSAGSIKIVYESDATFPFMVAFKPSWGSAVSLEPYSIITDGFNLPWPVEMTGTRAAAPGETIRFETSIYTLRT